MQTSVVEQITIAGNKIQDVEDMPEKIHIPLPQGYTRHLTTP
jgi:hypothetical protein